MGYSLWQSSIFVGKCRFRGISLRILMANDFNQISGDEMRCPGEEASCSTSLSTQ